MPVDFVALNQAMETKSTLRISLEDIGLSPELQLIGAGLATLSGGPEDNPLITNANAGIATLGGRGIRGSAIKGMVGLSMYGRALGVSGALLRGRAFSNVARLSKSNPRNVLTGLERGAMKTMRPVLTGQGGLIGMRRLPAFAAAYGVLNAIWQPDSNLGALAQTGLAMGATRSLVKNGGILGLLDKATTFNQSSMIGTYFQGSATTMNKINNQIKKVIKFVNGETPMVSSTSVYGAAVRAGNKLGGKLGVKSNISTVLNQAVSPLREIPHGKLSVTPPVNKSKFYKSVDMRRSGFRASDRIMQSEFIRGSGVHISQAFKASNQLELLQSISSVDDAAVAYSKISGQKLSNMAKMREAFQADYKKVTGFTKSEMGSLSKYYGSMYHAPMDITGLSDRYALKAMKTGKTTARPLSLSEITEKAYGSQIKGGKGSVFAGAKTLEDVAIRRGLAGQAIRKTMTTQFMATTSKILGWTWAAQLVGMGANAAIGATRWAERATTTLKSSVREMRNLYKNSGFGQGSVTSNQRILTERQRSLEAINNSQMNVRSYIGEEASVMASLY